MQKADLQLIKARLSYYIENGHLSNADMLQIIEHVGQYLNLCTRSEYARQSGKSYNAAKKFRPNILLFGVKFVVDND